MNGDVNTDYEKFSNVLLNLTDKHAPLKQKKMLEIQNIKLDDALSMEKRLLKHESSFDSSGSDESKLTKNYVHRHKSHTLDTKIPRKPITI